MIWSRPSRARELKHLGAESHRPERLSRPSRARELKQVTVDLVEVFAGSRPSRARELKPGAEQQQRPQQHVAPLAGA